MALTRLQNTDQIQKDIKELTTELENLRKTYEQYFLGIIREEPSKLRDKVKGLVQRNSGVAIQNATLKFQMQQCIARYNTFTSYWDRILREMEEGKYQRDVFKSKLHEKERSEQSKGSGANTKKTKASGEDQALQKLFEEYKGLKQQLKQDTKDLKFETFQAQIKGKIKNLSTEGMSFKIVQEGKETKIKLLAKKEKK